MSESYFHDKLKQELTDDDRESASVEFIKKSLNGTNSIVKIAVHDKEANIDDSIKLIDKNKRIIGKITVQVKTISKCNESKFEFQCPTSLFAYAEATDDVVILLAVDHKEKKVLWKHISRQLIYANREKASQDSILLHFNENERFDSKNAITTLEVWKSLFLDQHYLLTARTDSINSFIANLDTELIRLDPALIGEIQYYIDCREKIYRDLPLLKELLYPSVWKFGVAVFNYDPYNPNFMYGDTTDALKISK